jgi:hypothetical protein
VLAERLVRGRRASLPCCVQRRGGMDVKSSGPSTQLTKPKRSKRCTAAPDRSAPSPQASQGALALEEVSQ